MKQATVEPSIVSVLLAPSRCSTPLPRCCHIAVSFLFLTWASSSTAFTQRARVHVSLFKERSASRRRLFPMLSRTPELIRPSARHSVKRLGLRESCTFPATRRDWTDSHSGSALSLLCWFYSLALLTHATGAGSWHGHVEALLRAGRPRMQGRSSVIGGGLTGMNEHCT